MRRYAPSLAAVLGLILALAAPAWAQGPAFDPTRAAVRIKSHGASGTVIATAHGKSWILSCAHMFLDRHNRPSAEARARRLVLDGLAQPGAAVAGAAAARLLAWDYDADLSLIELDNGPFAFVPVAPVGHHPSGNLLSMGYDEMAWPVTTRKATLLLVRDGTTYTAEKPWHGRSGGGLIDLERRVLIGVVQGYEVTGPQRGLYVSHAAVVRFLMKHRPGLLAVRPAEGNRLPGQGLGYPFRSWPRPSPWPGCPLASG
jgi:hypothetical protein